MPATPARRAAREAISAVRERDAWAHQVVPGIVGSHAMDAREAASATRLAYGTVAASGTLDEAIDSIATKPTRIEPKVRDALQLAAYELLFTDSPSNAVVDQGVELAREMRPQAAGLANAVLRKLAERRESFPWGDPATDVAALARLHGHPVWIAELLVEEFGSACAGTILATNNLPAPLYLVDNPFAQGSADPATQLRAEGVETTPCGIPGCLRASGAHAAVASDVLRTGRVIVSDAGAQLAAWLVPTAPSARILEVGAGRGTKTLLLEAAAHRRDHEVDVVAVDNHEFKVELLRQRMEQLGVPGVTALALDAADPEALRAALGSSAHSVLVDAPCSGLGTLRRHPEQRWRMKPDDIASLAALGTRLLASAAHLVGPSGFVVYSTCTLTRTENRSVIEGFLASAAGAEFRRDPFADEVPSEWRRFLTEDGDFQSVPESGGPDGHYIARLKRR